LRPGGGIIEPVSSSACLTVTKGRPVVDHLTKGAISRSASAAWRGARDARIGVAAGDPDVAGRRRQDGVRAGRRAAVVVAGLQRDDDAVDALDAAGRPAGGDGACLGVQVAGPAVRLDGEDLAGGVEQDAADRRIGRRGTGVVGRGGDSAAERVGDDAGGQGSDGVVRCAHAVLDPSIERIGAHANAKANALP
jgi:hypothetical protein